MFAVIVSRGGNRGEKMSFFQSQREMILFHLMKNLSPLQLFLCVPLIFVLCEGEDADMYHPSGKSFEWNLYALVTRVYMIYSSICYILIKI